MIFDSQSQIQVFDAHTLFIRPDMVKSPTGYRTGHFPEIRPDTGPDLLSGTPLL